jgi:hypothetical protein
MERMGRTVVVENGDGSIFRPRLVFEDTWQTGIGDKQVAPTFDRDPHSKLTLRMSQGKRTLISTLHKRLGGEQVCRTIPIPYVEIRATLQVVTVTIPVNTSDHGGDDLGWTTNQPLATCFLF